MRPVRRGGRTQIKLYKYSNFYNGETQQDASECPPLLVYIMNKEPFLCSTDNYMTISHMDSLSELLFSFV